MSEQDFCKGEKAFEKMTNTDPEEAFGKDNRQKTLAEAWDYFRKMFPYEPASLILGYDNIVKHDQTDLTLGDFIACTDGKPLINNYKGAFEEIADEEFSKEYQQALDRVVYKGWTLDYQTDSEFGLENGESGIIFIDEDFIELNNYKGLETRGDMAGFELTDQYAKKLYL